MADQGNLGQLGLWIISGIALIHRVAVANPSFWTEGVGEISYINQKNSSKLCFGVRIQNSESRRGIKISSKKF